MRNLSIGALVAMILGLAAGAGTTVSAAPIGNLATVPDRAAADNPLLDRVHWRGWRHCHWRYGWRRCHGGYAYYYGGYPYYYGWPGLYFRFGHHHRHFGHHRFRHHGHFRHFRHHGGHFRHFRHHGGHFRHGGHSFRGRWR